MRSGWDADAPTRPRPDGPRALRLGRRRAYAPPARRAACAPAGTQTRLRAPGPTGRVRSGWDADAPTRPRPDGPRALRLGRRRAYAPPARRAACAPARRPKNDPSPSCVPLA
ncbi:hypothetical protein MSAS_06940 [Mycobacterium saskatchewanense]|nr:hypothetical protein MSAS_06940 [Mycobacterium saskatchewanense]